MQTVAALVASSLVGVVLSLAAEAPVIGLEKLLLRRPGACLPASGVCVYVCLFVQENGQ